MADCEVYLAERAHLTLRYKIEQFVHEKYFKVGRKKNIKTESLGKGNCCDLGMRLCNINNLWRANTLSSLTAPEMYFFLTPGYINLIIQILHKILNWRLMAVIVEYFFYSKLERLLVKSSKLRLISQSSQFFRIYYFLAVFASILSFNTGCKLLTLRETIIACLSLRHHFRWILKLFAAFGTTTALLTTTSTSHFLSTLLFIVTVFFSSGRSFGGQLLDLLLVLRKFVAV